MLAATNVKMSGSEQRNSEQEHIPCIKRVTKRRFHVVVVQNNGKECVLHPQSYILRIRHIGFLSVLAAVTI